MSHDLHEIKRSKMYERLYAAISYRAMDEGDIIRLKKEMEAGIFVSDRISNDPYFDSGLAVKRYLNWLHDLLEGDSLPYVMLYKGDPSGFIILQTKDGQVYHSVLGAAYAKYRKTGLGIVQKEQEIVRSLGGKRVETQVSSNNLSQLKALELNGYRTVGINHILVKHNK